MKRNRLVHIVLFIFNMLAVLALVVSYFSVYSDPIDNRWLPLFGLAYPLLLIINLVFIIIWTLRNRRLFWLSTIGILIGFKTLTSFFQINFYEERPKADDEIKILSYNVRLFGYYDNDGGKKRDKIFDYLVKEAADVMCFQEFYYTENKIGFVTRDSLLAIQDAKFLHEKYTHEFRHRQNFGVVTLSKYPIVFKGYIPFDNDINNFCIYSDIQLPSGDTIRVYNAHLASIRFQKEDYAFISGDEKSKTQSTYDAGKRIVGRLQTAFSKRSIQITKIMENIKSSPYPTFFAGDFNDSPISYCYSTIRSQLEDAFISKGNGIGNTYNGLFPSLRIDYIFHSSDIECTDYHIFRGDLSDHYSIHARFKLKHDE